MFARFHQTPSRLQVSLRESRRVGGKPRCEHIARCGWAAASLLVRNFPSFSRNFPTSNHSVPCLFGSVPKPMTIAGRVEFYRRASERFAGLANRIGAEDKKKIVIALRARVPPVTDDEILAGCWRL
jgi:hypothetical protein